MIHDEVKNPFPGLRPFEFGDNHLFFGRDEQTTELTTRLRKNRFVAVVGTSGSGKSSLVRAGLMPELLSGTMASAGSSWETTIMRPGGDPITNLAAAIVEADLYDSDEEDIASQVRATLTRSGLGLVEAIRQSKRPEGTNFLLVVDQFEEIFRFRRSDDATDEQAAFFVNLLLEASAQADLPLYVIITMRSDFLGECSQFPRLADTVNEGEFLIPRLNRDQRKEAIVGPVKVAGGEIADRLLLRLLNDIGDDPDQLPILQHALMRTWDLFEERGGDGALDLEHYQATGGMGEALSRHADEVYGELPDAEHKRIAEKLFKSLTEKVDANRGIRRPMQLAELHEICGGEESHLREVLDAFRKTGCTFLMPAGETKIKTKTVIDISHESLMRAWRSLRNWVDEEAQSAKIYRRLADTATLYHEDKAGLYRDPDLQISLSWREESRPNKTWANRYYPGFESAMAFLDQSQEEAEREERKREVARQREVAQAKALAKAKARSATIFKFACIGVTILAITAVFAMIEARESRDEADRQIINLAKRSIATGEAMDAEDDHLGALVWYADAIRLAKKDPTIQSKYQAVFKTKLDNAVKLRYSLNIEEPIGFARLMLGGTKAVVVTQKGNFIRSMDNQVYILDLETGNKRAIYSSNGMIRGTKINKQKTIMAFLEENARTYHAIDLTSAKSIFKKQLSFQRLRSPRFNEQGNHLILAGHMQDIGGSISVIDLASAKEINKKDFSGYLGFLHSGKQSLIGFSTSKINSGIFYSTWDWKTGKDVASFNEPGQKTGIIVQTLIDQQRGNIIAATVDYPDTPQQATYIQVLNPDNKASIYDSPKKSESLDLAVLSPNQKYLALARSDGVVEVHDMDSLAIVWESEQKQIGIGQVGSLEFSPDGSLLLAAGGGVNLGVWETSTGRLITSDLKHGSGLAMASWNELGNAFLTSSKEGELRLYEIPNLMGSKYLAEVVMIPETTVAIAEAMATRTIDEGKMVSLANNQNSAAPDLSILPAIHQYPDSDQIKNWHKSQVLAAKGNKRWSAVKFHLDKASAITPLGEEEIQSRFEAHLNLGLYELANKDLEALKQDKVSTAIKQEFLMPDLANKWKQDVWYYSGYYSCANQDEGFSQEYINHNSLKLNEEKDWIGLPDFKPADVPDNMIVSGEMYADAPENSVYYAAKIFTVDEAGIYDLAFDSDDQMKAWINGSLVHSFFRQRGRGMMMNPERDSAGSWLNKGKNLIIIKIVNGILASGFYFEIGKREEKIVDLQRNYLLLATDKKTAVPTLGGDAIPSSKDIMGVALFTKDKKIASVIQEGLLKNNNVSSIINGTALNPNSYIKPKELPSPDQFKNGFTVECIITKTNKLGAFHIISNGGSFAESGFSLMAGNQNGGILRGEFQNTESNEKIMMDAPYPFDDNWHHVALTYDPERKAARLYLDGKPATQWTPYKSPLIFNPKRLRIGDNELRGMGFSGGGITDVTIWPTVLSEEIILNLSSGSISEDLGTPLFSLPLRFDNIEAAKSDKNFTSENINWKKSTAIHPRHNDGIFVYPTFQNQNFSDPDLYAALGALEYRIGNYEKSLKLLIQSQNNGRYSTEVNFHPFRFQRGDSSNSINRDAAPYLIMAYKKCGYDGQYSRLSGALNEYFNQFEIRTAEIPGEIDVMERIKFKSLQREMNALAEE